MSVNGSDTAFIEHYGSIYAMVDYKSKVHNLYASASFRPTEKLSFFGKVDYNKAEASMEQINMPAGADLDNILNGALPNQDFDFTKANTYSDFDYKLITFSGGLKYKLTPAVTYTLDGSYSDLTDDKGYVFGNESGSYFVIRSGFYFSF